VHWHTSGEVHLPPFWHEGLQIPVQLDRIDIDDGYKILLLRYEVLT